MIRLFKSPKGDKAKAKSLWRSRRGNVALITAFMIIPLTVALGTAYDFTMAESRQDQIDGMADIATLSAVTPAMMAVDPITAKAYALKVFTSQLATVPGVTYSLANISTAGSVDNSTGTATQRTMVITYTAASTNVFASLVGMPTFPLKGASTATSSTAPNIDFYLLLDTSPSMEIAATSSGIATMIANTQQESDVSPPTPQNQGYDSWKANAKWPKAWPYAGETTPTGNGCAFGCHETSPDTGTYAGLDGKPIPCTATGVYTDGTHIGSTFPSTGRDNYDLSRCLGVVLRSDLVTAAAENLVTTAATTEANNLAKYQMAFFVTDSNTQASPLTLTTLQVLTPDLSVGGAAQTAAAKVQPLTMCKNNQYVCNDKNNDEDTNLDQDLATMNTSGNTGYIPTPGQGTNNPTDTPQKVLFIVTDGQNDYGSSRIYPPMDFSGAKCTAIKNRGIRIAVLYTTFTPLEESWYEQDVEPYLGGLGGFPSTAPPPTDLLATAAANCASSGLYYQVSTDGDISTALNHLFQEAIATARLLH